MSETLAIGLSSWIIQDGNYGDFEEGQQAAFAVEFYDEPPLVPGPAERSLRHIEGDTYRASGQVIHVGDRWWAIDVGMLIFRDFALPQGIHEGQWLSGLLSLGVDPFMYFERLALTPRAPALIYDWVIERIEIQTAPFVEIEPRYRVRDVTKLGWRAISRTDAWKDDGGNADYVFHCRRLPGPARHKR